MGTKGRDGGREGWVGREGEYCDFKVKRERGSRLVNFPSLKAF